MYKIIGADGKEYGPVTIEQLRQWITEGRADAQTMVLPEGGADWMSLGSVPEFAGLSGGPPAPMAGPVDPQARVAELLASGYTIDIGSCIRRSWYLWKAHFGLMVGTSLVVSLLLGGIGTAIGFAIRLPFGLRSMAGSLAGFGANTLWTFAVGGALMGGLFAFNLKLIRGQPATIGDAFAGFSKCFGALTATYIVMCLLIYVGLALCLIPGIYLGVAWIFALPLVIDKNLGFWEAMELSRKIITKNWWTMLALMLLAGLVGAAGIVACCIGVIFTAPLTHATLMYAYEDIFGERAAQTA